MDFKLDESYTPSKISVRAGTGIHDLKARRICMKSWAFQTISVTVAHSWNFCWHGCCVVGKKLGVFAVCNMGWALVPDVSGAVCHLF